MAHWFSLSHRPHTGRLRPHEHTSYMPLGLILLITGFALITYTASATGRPGPEAGSIGLTGSVPSKPPTTAAVITAPTDEKHFATSPARIDGTCPPETLVELYKNDIFAGSVMCDKDGKFTSDIDLLIGKNTLIARVYDALNQPGPDSKSVTVYYDALPFQPGALGGSFDFNGSQLLLNTDAVYRGVFPEQDMTMPIDILGGTPPYAVNIQWGDANNKVVPRGDNQSFKVVHAYKKPGTYRVTLQATDATGRVAFLAVASIVNGQPEVTANTASASTTAETNSLLSKLLVLWPLYTTTLGIVISFWLGERREKIILKRQGRLLPG